MYFSMKNIRERSAYIWCIINLNARYTHRFSEEKKLVFYFFTKKEINCINERSSLKCEEV